MLFVTSEGDPSLSLGRGVQVSATAQNTPKAGSRTADWGVSGVLKADLVSVTVGVSDIGVVRVTAVEHSLGIKESNLEDSVGPTFLSGSTARGKNPLGKRYKKLARRSKGLGGKLTGDGVGVSMELYAYCSQKRGTMLTADSGSRKRSKMLDSEASDLFEDLAVAESQPCLAP